MLQRAIYLSDAVGMTGQSILSIAQIVGVSDANNRRDHLTGVLMHHRGQFMQLIEGAPADLDRLLARLARDPRHENMRFLHRGDAPDRCFMGQPMARIIVDGQVGAVLGDRRLDQLPVEEFLDLFHACAAQLDLAA